MDQNPAKDKETYVILRRVVEPKDRIIVALDVDQPEKAEKLIELLAPHVGLFKNGLESMHAMRRNLLVTKDEEVAINNLRAYRRLHRLAGHQSFDDAKLKDIPNTVEKASVCISQLGVRMYNVHCLGGPKMMTAAANAARAVDPRPLVIGVTLLTSLSFDDLKRMGIRLAGEHSWESTNLSKEDFEKFYLQKLVIDLAKLAKECGLDGVVCSPHEASAIREACGPNFLLVCPSVRPDWAAADDQKRIMTPGEAIKAGADYLVIGRPITKPPPGNIDPIKAACLIANEIAQAQKEMER